MIEETPTPRLRKQFENAVVLHKMSQQQIHPEDDWFDDNDMIDVDRLPGHLRGPVRTMFNNAGPLVDVLCGIVHGKLSDL